MSGRLDYRPLQIGGIVVGFCVVGILINRRPLGDIVLMVVGGLAIVGLAVYYAAQTLRRRRVEREQAQREQMARETPWKPFSRPVLGTSFWEVGVERVTPHGLVLKREEAFKLPRGAQEEILDAEGEMLLRAGDYNERKVGM